MPPSHAALCPPFFRAACRPRGGYPCSSGEDGWKLPLGFVGVMTLTGFILGCVATDMARNNAAAIEALHGHPKSQCAFGDALFGEELHVGHKGGSSYQVRL